MSTNDEEILVLIGERIRQRRKDFKMTQNQLAEKMGLDRSAISKWEKGTQAIPVYELHRLCQVLSCDVGYLFGEYNTPRKAISDLAALTCLSDRAASRLLQFTKPMYVPELFTQDQKKEAIDSGMPEDVVEAITDQRSVDSSDAVTENFYRIDFLSFIDRLLSSENALELSHYLSTYWHFCRIQEESTFPLEKQDEIDLYQFKATKQFTRFIEKSSFYPDNEQIKKRFYEKMKDPDSCDNNAFASWELEGLFD